MSDVKQWMTTAVCKVCNAVGTIRRIVYGFPTDEAIENENIVLGGCCITDNDPKYACTVCHWECNRNRKTGELIGFSLDL
jgi:hypothetical protein